MWYKRLFLVACALLAGWSAPTEAVAQHSTITGTVLNNETGAAIPGIVVEVWDRRQRRRGRAVTDDRGAFLFYLPQQGAYRFRAGGAGYRRTRTPVIWTDGRDSLTVRIRLDPDVVLLAPLEITAWSAARGSHVLDGFRARQRAGIGSYFTRDQIERLSPAYVSDILATLPGVSFGSSGRGNRRTIYIGRSAGYGGGCPAQIYIDGLLLNRRSAATDEDLGFTLDDAVTPNVVEAIEVYKGLSTVPAEFLNPDSRCGVVAVWTRRGS